MSSLAEARRRRVEIGAIMAQETTDESTVEKEGMIG